MQKRYTLASFIKINEIQIWSVFFLFLGGKKSNFTELDPQIEALIKSIETLAVYMSQADRRLTYSWLGSYRSFKTYVKGQTLIEKLV